MQAEPLADLDAWLVPYRAHWAGRHDALEDHLARKLRRQEAKQP